MGMVYGVARPMYTIDYMYSIDTKLINHATYSLSLVKIEIIVYSKAQVIILIGTRNNYAHKLHLNAGEMY